MTRSPFWMMLAVLCPASALAAGIQVKVTLTDAEATERGHTCTVWRSAEGFRTDASVSVATVTSSKENGQWVCSITLPETGRYAIGVMDDANSNGLVDTNWTGRPIEGWGTSNNVAPTFRAPSFDESATELKDGSSLSIQVRRR